MVNKKRSSLRVQNFKALGDVSLELRNLNYLLGANSVGKSSLGQAILMAIQSLNNRGFNVLLGNGELVSLGYYDQIVRKGQSNLEVSLPLINCFRNELTGNHSDGRLTVKSSLKASTEFVRANPFREKPKLTSYELELESSTEFWGVESVNSKFSQVLYQTKKGDFRKMIAHSASDHIETLQAIFAGANVYSLKSEVEQFRENLERLSKESEEISSPRVFPVTDLEALCIASYEIGPAVDEAGRVNLAWWFGEFNKLWSQGLVQEETWRSDGLEFVSHEGLAETSLKLSTFFRLGYLEEYGIDGPLPKNNPDFEQTDWGWSVNNFSEYKLIYRPNLDLDLFSLFSQLVGTLDDGTIRRRPTSFGSLEPLDFFFEAASRRSNFVFDFNSVNQVASFIGPLRQDGFAQARSWPSKNNTYPVGIKGEHTAYALLSHDPNFAYGAKKEKSFSVTLEKSEFDFLARILSGFEPQLVKASEEINQEAVGEDFSFFPLPNGEKTQQLWLAMDSWLSFLELGTDLRIQDLGVNGFEITLDGRRLYELGSGVAQSLPVLAISLMSRGELVIIEQPELHLHPAAQQRLGDFFVEVAKSGRKLLIETHSEYLVTRLRRAISLGQISAANAQLFFAEPGKNGTKITASDLNATGGFKYWPQGFFAQLDSDILDILSQLDD